MSKRRAFECTVLTAMALITGYGFVTHSYLPIDERLERELPALRVAGVHEFGAG